jgi:NAD(P)-dependent dehydrogenase (short-subunit alcohol dehydrogenase family)
MVVVSAMSSWMRLPFSGAYTASKLAVNCLSEFLASENPSVPIFCVHPGGILTDITKDMPETVQKLMVDTVQLPACTILSLTNGSYDWLSGR